jgi:hypothetical protein
MHFAEQQMMTDGVWPRKGRERKAQCYCIKVPIHYSVLLVIESGAVRVWVTPSASGPQFLALQQMIIFRRPFERRVCI